MAQWEIKKTKYNILSGMLWMANIFTLTFFIYENGMGYFACAYEFFALIGILFADSMSDTMGRMMRSRIQKSQVKNAYDVFRGGVSLAIFYSLVGSVILWAMADFVSLKATGVKYSADIIRLLIPALVLMFLTAPIKGYFSGIGTVGLGSVSSIVRRVTTFGLSFAAIKVGGGYGEKVSALLKNTEFINYYKAYALPFAISLGFLIEFVFLIYMYFTAGKRDRIMGKEIARYHEPVLEISIDIAKNMFPYNITNFVLRSFILAGLCFYGEFFLNRTEYDASAYISSIGSFYGKYLSVSVFFAFFISFMVICFKNYCIGGIRRNELKFTRERMAEGVHMILIFGAFLAVAFAVIGSSFIIGCFHDYNVSGTDMFTWGFALVCLIPLAEYFKVFISYTSKKRAELFLALLGMIFGIATLFLLGKSGVGLMKALIISLSIYTGVLALGNGFFSLTGFKCRIPILAYVILPIGTAALTGILMMLLNKGLINILGGLLSFVICFFVGALGNLLLLLALHNLTEEELVSMPLGKAVIKFGITFNFFDY